MSKQQICSTR